MSPDIKAPLLLAVENVNCNGCVNKIRRALAEHDSSSEVEAALDLSPKQLTIHSGLAEQQVLSLLEDMGYAPRPVENEKSEAVAHQPAVLAVSVTDPEPIALQSETSVQLALEGITCAGCVSTIQGALDKVVGAQAATVNFASRTAQVSGDVPVEELIRAIEAVGYGAEQIFDPDQAENIRAEKERAEYQRKLRQSYIGIGLGVPMMIYGLAGGPMSVATGFERSIWLLVGLATLAVLYWAGRHFYTGAYKALKARHANMDALIALGTGSAWLYSMVVVLMPGILPESARHLYFEASAMIIGLINLGQALEIKARGRTSQAIRRLLDLRPKTARVVRDGRELDIPVEQVVVGDILRIRAGEKIPVDGDVLEGSTHVDESMLTGEAVPVNKRAGAELAAGTVNGQGTVLYRATRIGRDTVLAQIIDMVGKAQNTKPPIAHLADKVSAVFVPSVIVIALLTALAWYNFGPQPTVINMLIAATSVLIIACPCALGLATPISTMIGVGKAAEQGGLIRNGEALQRASEITTVVLDKTGTITEGKPSVTNFRVTGTLGEAEVKQLAAALEQGSEHPLAQAVIAYCELSEPLRVQAFEAVTGQGVRGQVSGKPVLLGNQRLMQLHGISLQAAQSEAQAWEQQARTVIYCAVDGELVGLFGVADPIKSDALQAIRRLQAQAIRVVMLTGDNQATAAAVAKEVGVDAFHAELMPEDKLDWIKQLQSEGQVVAMAGDGINDAPALAQADVGFAIGGGTDVAIESADITLMRGSLQGISDVIGISRATLKNIKQNLWGAFAYNSLGIPIAAGVLFPVTGWLLSPVIAGAAMSLSSVTVVSNANRLRLWQPGEEK